MKLSLFAILLISFFPSPRLQAQRIIHFDNPSFEGEPADATVPVGWLPCEEGTTPDILPGFWGVYQEASEGDTYVGLITRGDGTWESITQRLDATLSPEECYKFTMDLARSATYNQYNRPIKLRVWGSSYKCEKKQLLLETDFVDHAFWKSYEVDFYPKVPVNYIIFEAFYQEGPYRHPGNILIDNLSPIKRCPRA
ncbi:hypothetical protein [Flavilitoribacter nigricans]|uniref:CBM-cenC domain-containing protein n=1 Tax=Flavilitoribacter nigricans (strain ATCC 23147 / DSM 23189 / NBRC 102662 / NCIMB 1420 / SS-2) TaxID=1122177 RepID=A0A2D0NJP9_FLAN2|nr:hypothetical protein [Flavilitoribacter nigricans]PHN08429.1 hypothetical protein CRP01_00515 [Flavilitoribacter nigricans DSM 23189 = NBRC 102662]